MQGGRAKLYTLLLGACLAGYAWIFSHLAGPGTVEGLQVCWFKTGTGLPCPSCGTTRALLALLHGNPVLALYINPFSIPLAAALLLAPFWTAYDLLSGKSSLLRLKIKLEAFLNKKSVALPLIALVLMNWAWNISKGL